MDQALSNLQEVCEQGKTHGDVEAAKEITDLLRWMPDFVADSDASEESYMMILERSNKLLKKSEQLLAEKDGATRLAHTENYLDYIQSLKSVIEIQKGNE